MPPKLTVLWEDPAEGEAVAAEGKVVLFDNKDTVLMYSQENFERIVRGYLRLTHVWLGEP